ncbi:hypothetical protein A2U01_0016046, partial [Trifolium medium]|nr:hypothetical protein [Trifolium medium]
MTRDPSDPNPYDPSSKTIRYGFAFVHPWTGPGGGFGPEPVRPGPLSTPTY